MKRKNLGKWGESKAEAFLKENGVRILARNVRNSYGEIDLIAEEDHTLIFVEVKTAKTKKFGFPEVSVNKKKQQKLVECALAHMQEKPNQDSAWRIDVVAVYVLSDNRIEIKWFKNAITG